MGRSWICIPRWSRKMKSSLNVEDMRPGYRMGWSSMEVYIWRGRMIKHGQSEA
jgi:hypothetical protein